MATVKQDPDALRKLAKDLGTCMQSFIDGINGLLYVRTQLEAAWKDEQGQEFLEHFQNAYKRMVLLQDEVEQTRSDLRRDASLLDDYRKTHMEGT